MDEWLQAWLRELPGELANEAVWLALLSGAAWAAKHRQLILTKLKLKPKPVVVPLQGQALISSAAQVTAVAKPVTALWNVEAPTPPLSTRLVDEAIELLSVLPRHL
jgi:hypothetical protein